MKKQTPVQPCKDVKPPVAQIATTYQFEGCISDKFPVRKTFMEAWHDMYLWVKAQLDGGGLSHQVLETAIWIEVANECGKNPIMFCDARDVAIQTYGWVKPA